MAHPDAYNTLAPGPYRCLVCNKRFGPALYWHDDGVFCGVLCGLGHCRRRGDYARP